ncbi:hypothetical protein NQ315_013892 [Exocentrus adspersus]|uniref:Ferritin n=1 Tax=Exocentrus adspersus TaxID=1586481 RepID=A0AAV8V8S9_9CUCU|nr:hypothetical protein NQ315_013892 [Exocentrus adspersus]
MISSNLTEFLQWLFQKNIPKFLIQRVESSKTLKPVLNNEVCTYSYRNLIHSKKCILHNNKNLLMKNSNVYENLINKVMPRTAFCTKSENRSCKPSPGRHEYHKETEDSVNNQIGAEFNAAFSYLSMACYFGRTEISLPGCQGFFTNMYEEELEHAMIFINHQLLRGGYVLLPTISLSHSQDWKSIKKAFATALEMEKSIKEKLVSLFDVAETHKDLQVMDIVSTQFMEEQVPT